MNRYRQRSGQRRPPTRVNDSNKSKEFKFDKLLVESGGSGQRWTYRARRHTPATIGKEIRLDDVVDVKRTINLPNLPDALPCFTMEATVEVTLKNGGKKLYTKAVEIDVRTGGGKPEKTRG